MEIYLILLLEILILAKWLPDRQYGAAMTLSQTLICGFRHPHLTGDLMKYHWFFLYGSTLKKNFGFDLWMQGIAGILDGNYQMFLFLTAALSQVAVGFTLIRQCRKPWLGFLSYHCLGFYIFGFSAIKQALAMGLVLLAYDALESGSSRKCVVWTLLAGCIHRPALVMVIAWFLTRFRFDRGAMGFYLLLGAAVWCFRQPLTALAARLYGVEETLVPLDSAPGGRFFLMLLLLIGGVLLRGTADGKFARLCHLMALGTVIQLLAVYGNLFSRLADYCLQFGILFLPGMLDRPEGAALPFDENSRRWLEGILAAGLILFYWVAYLNVPILYETDNYLRYRFFWQRR